jgi:polysaccharide export outer membrane protein
MLLAAILLMVTACASSSRSRENLPRSFEPAAAGGLAPAAEVRISPLDLLEIKVFGVDELNGDYQVQGDGGLRLPLAGVMQAEGLTAFDLARKIEERLGASYLQHPEVTVRISESFGRQVTVEGSVARPGMYPVRGPMTLLQVVAVAGGATDLANPRRIIVFRTIDGQKRAAGFDLRKIRSGEAEDPAILSSDIVVVDGSEARTKYRDFIQSVPLVGLFVAAF